MSAINMDLDKRFHFNFKRKVTVGGQTYTVVFNDAMDQALLDLQLEMQDFYNQQTKKTDEFEEMTVDQRKKYLADQFRQVVDDAEQLLDKVLGQKGAGKHIYDYYNQQSYALFETIRVLRETKEKLDGTAKKQQRQKHQARIAQYTGQKERVKDNANTNKKRSK
ncbi:hypothetical protein DT304_00115 [Lactobacillus reuteri]|uniref:hypothetical protein n=1 Tax=Limosilactobacillus reuteri TaxID=1598 RepID=UPI0016527E83|nr:hypothetical protein [Limosilactobacillus reuteri]MBC6909741.1 hypothetical protein [Limosilactobacillus reuteri]